MYNRTIVLIAYLIYCGWCAYLAGTTVITTDIALAMISAGAAPVATYVGIKGINANGKG